MLIQKGVSKEYVDVYLQNRIKTQKQEAEKMKEFCQKHIIRIH